MLEIYFDDSGTHNGSRVVVWGGVLGYKDFMDELEVAWKARLLEPCEGKPPIKCFHSSHLAASEGEFEGYNVAERDRTRYNFRKVIVDAGLTILSFGISVDDWNNLVVGDARAILGGAERSIFGQAVRGACRAAKPENQPLSFQFDRGRSSPSLLSMIQPALDAAEADGNSVNYGFSKVADNMALQAADLVAHETYQFFTKYVDANDAEPGPHLRALFTDAHDSAAAWVGNKQIQKMLNGIEPLIAQMRASDEE